MVLHWFCWGARGQIKGCELRFLPIRAFSLSFSRKLLAIGQGEKSPSVVGLESMNFWVGGGVTPRVACSTQEEDGSYFQ